MHSCLPISLSLCEALRGFVHERLLHTLQKLGWQCRLRRPCDTLVHLEADHLTAVKELCPSAGHARFFQQGAILGVAVGLVSLALAALLAHPNDPWFVASSEPTDETTLEEYGLRFDIEESFRDEKSGGFQLQTSRLATPDAAFAPAAGPGLDYSSPDQSRSGSCSGKEKSLCGSSLGASSLVSEAGVAVAQAEGAAWRTRLRAFLARPCT